MQTIHVLSFASVRSLWQVVINLSESLFFSEQKTKQKQNVVLTAWTIISTTLHNRYNTELILGLRSANERRRYFVTTSLIGWAHT